MFILLCLDFVVQVRWTLEPAQHTPGHCMVMALLLQLLEWICVYVVEGREGGWGVGGFPMVPAAEYILLLIVDVSHPTPTQIPASFSAGCLLNLSSDCSQHRPKTWNTELSLLIDVSLIWV